MKPFKILQSTLFAVFAFTATAGLSGVDELPAEIQKTSTVLTKWTQTNHLVIVLTEIGLQKIHHLGQ